MFLSTCYGNTCFCANYVRQRTKKEHTQAQGGIYKMQSERFAENTRKSKDKIGAYHQMIFQTALRTFMRH
jgi:hypothetical protein